MRLVPVTTKLPRYGKDVCVERHAIKKAAGGKDPRILNLGTR
jgi:hypothetical protein